VVRKCRIDFGVDIEIQPRRIFPTGDWSAAHCVVGKIRYGSGSDARCGWLLYLKSSLTGDEPEDILQYKASHPDFPQESTLNQFFTESQFESYRKLGLHVIKSVMQDYRGNGSKPAEPLNPFTQRQDQLEELFNSLWNSWYPPAEVADGVSSQHADRYSELIARLAEDDLRDFTPQILELGGTDQERYSGGRPSHGDPNRIEQASFLYCLSLIQLMENVWADLHLRDNVNRESPANGGWIRVFQYWARQPLFEKTWERQRHSYNSLFQDFFELMRTETLKRSP
jgi:hypothetical protein